MYLLKVFLLIIPASLLSFNALSQTDRSGKAVSAEQILFQDAAAYSERFGVLRDQAMNNLRLQQDAGDLDGVLRSREAGNFAGLWIEHTPEFRVFVRFAGRMPHQQIAQYLPNGGRLTANNIRMLDAKWSLSELRERQVFVGELAEQFELRADSEIDVKANRVNVYTTDTEAFSMTLAEAAVELPEGIDIIQSDALAQPEVLRAGSSLSTCTAGFTVKNSFTGEQGISTAAHCGNAQYYSGISLPFRNEDQEGNQDVQWHSTCNLFDISNDFYSGIGVRNVIGTRHRNDQAIGTYLCKFGMTTGRTCGTIASKSFAPGYVSNASSTFIRVAPTSQYPDLSAGGDSGSPWFVEEIAYGIHSGGFNGGSYDGGALYMAINYISSIGVSVLTSDPGECNQAPIASFTWDNPFNNFVEFDASASFDPDGSIVRYEWTFGDGSSTQITTNPTTTHNYSSDGSYFVQLKVVDNNGASGFDFQSVWMCSDPQAFDCPAVH